MVHPADASAAAGAMTGHDLAVDTAENYRRFGRETHGRSPAYGELANAVAADQEVLAFLAMLPAAKRQPNLLFAAAQYLLGAPADIGRLRDLIGNRTEDLATLMRHRRTQTNEPARCATLVPALAQLDQPLALLEVGAAAGLTLLPDRYSYDFAGHRLSGTDPVGPVLTCQTHGPIPLPERVPTVVWRAGIDLNPLDAADPDDARWLECLLWPGEGDRHARLHAALEVARRDRPRVHRGDLVEDLARVAAGAPSQATLVIYHSAVLAYVDVEKRRQFATAVHELRAVWLSNEAPGILPAPENASVPSGEDSFVLIRDGRQMLASTDSHGSWISWCPPS